MAKSSYRIATFASRVTTGCGASRCAAWPIHATRSIRLLAAKCKRSETGWYASGTRFVRAPQQRRPRGHVARLGGADNVLEEGGLGGVKVQGETPIWMISPRFIPYFEPGDDPAGFLWDGNPLVNTAGGDPPISHFGSYIDDQDTLVIDADRTRVRLEFDDLAGGGTGNPVAGSGQVEGNGVAQDSSMAWYRDTGGSFYQRLTCTNCTAFATTAFETMHAMHNSILSSMLVSNGTTQQVNVTIAASLLGPNSDAAGEDDSGYPLYFNRPAVYIEGATTLQWQDEPTGMEILSIFGGSIWARPPFKHSSSTTRSSVPMAGRVSTANPG